MTGSRIPGKTALVTGASTGIGSAAAVKLASKGVNVAVHYNHNRIGAEETAALARVHGVETMVLQADVRNAAEVKAMFDNLAAQWGRLDILVNNAAVSPNIPFLETTVEDWNTTIATNLSSIYLCSHAALDRMVTASSGSIVNVSSVHGTTTGKGFSIYAASKGGVDALTRALAGEFGGNGIRVNSLIVGPVEVERTANTYAELDSETVSKMIPLGRWARPDEIASAIVFLALDESSYINGANIRIDGGVLAQIPNHKDPERSASTIEDRNA